MIAVFLFKLIQCIEMFVPQHVFTINTEIQHDIIGVDNLMGRQVKDTMMYGNQMK